MAKTTGQNDDDNLLARARIDADALGKLYERHYDRIFRFCVHRLFDRQTAEDVTSTIFLQVAEKIGAFPGRTEDDFRNWLYAVAANCTNAYIRKTTRRKNLLEKAVGSMTIAGGRPDDSPGPDWPTLYAAILRLKPKHQTIITLRFFENLQFEQIAEILNVPSATVRVTLHRVLKKLRAHLQAVVDGEK